MKEDKVNLRATAYEYLGGSLLPTEWNQGIIDRPMTVLTIRNCDNFKTFAIALTKEHTEKLCADLEAALRHPKFK